MNNHQEQRQRPFFSAFLEHEVNKGQSAHVQGGGDDQTKKYPSDQEDGTDPISDEIQTKKYPSDQEDGTDPLQDEIQTKKYPSDHDE